MKADKFFDDDNVLAMYLKEINRIPLLSHEDEEKYASLAAQGDKEAREILIKSNLRFVVNVAKKFRNKGLPMADLINEGNIGLINAIEKYDVSRGYHFISYAVWWIRQSILKAIGEKSKMIRLPLNRFGELVQIEKARKVMYEASGREPDAAEIAEHLRMDRKDVAELLSISREYVSLDTPVKQGTRDASTTGNICGPEGSGTSVIFTLSGSPGTGLPPRTGGRSGSCASGRTCWLSFLLTTRCAAWCGGSSSGTRPGWMNHYMKTSAITGPPTSWR